MSVEKYDPFDYSNLKHIPCFFGLRVAYINTIETMAKLRIFGSYLGYSHGEQYYPHNPLAGAWSITHPYNRKCIPHLNLDVNTRRVQFSRPKFYATAACMCAMKLENRIGANVLRRAVAATFVGAYIKKQSTSKKMRRDDYSARNEIFAGQRSARHCICGHDTTMIIQSTCSRH